MSSLQHPRLALLLCALAACGGDDDGDGTPGPDAASADGPLAPDGPVADAPVADAGLPDGAATADASPATGQRRKYVSSQQIVPTTPTQAQTLGFDLDGDGAVDNVLGQIASTLASQGLDPQAVADDAVAAGDMLALHLVVADDLTSDASVDWTVFVGADQANPDFGGGGSFTIDPAAPAASPISGSITAGHFVGGPGVLDLETVVFGAPVRLHLVGARIDAQLTASSCTGKLGGGLPESELETVVYPTLAAAMTAQIAADPQSSNSQTLRQLFDANMDGAISAAELSSNNLIQALFQPDVDLLDAMGHPGQDGSKESVSVGLGFSCVGAVFAAPGD